MDADWKTWDTLGKRVRGRRQQLKMTQTQLATAAGMNQGDVSKIERGEIQQTTKVVQLAKALDCNPVWMATGDGEMTAAVGQPERQGRTPLRKGDVFEALSEEEATLMNAYRRMSDKDRQEVADDVAARAARAEREQQAVREVLARFGVISAAEISDKDAAEILATLMEESQRMTSPAPNAVKK
jgi:transcriptional regulator with XRE-family HTH domain